jgi:hypothetical protein
LILTVDWNSTFHAYGIISCFSHINLTEFLLIDSLYNLESVLLWNIFDGGSKLVKFFAQKATNSEEINVFCEYSCKKITKTAKIEMAFSQILAII